MSLDYDKLNERVRELKNIHDHSFECNYGEKEVSVSGMKISSARTSHTNQKALILIEPRCRYYGNDMYKLGDGRNTSGGSCNNFKEGRSSCTYCSYEEIDIHNSR